MSNNKSTEENQELQRATKDVPIFPLPLNKEQLKVETAFNNNIVKALALLRGAVFAPTTQIPGDEMSKVMDELFKEDVENLTKEVKEGMRDLMKKKVEFDRSVKQETLKFQAAIIDQKKALNQDFNDVMSKIKDIESLKNSYLETFKVAEESTE